ncbi:hypothetical protein Ga0466249_002170 [Sporomusaceae bacterium BoRhaA]|nr:hypothetical protein [Pelorhabdus rhamnosifermentans]
MEKVEGREWVAKRKEAQVYYESIGYFKDIAKNLKISVDHYKRK